MGYGGIVIRNLYARVSPHPDYLGVASDLVGPDNDAELARCSELDLTVLAWGTRRAARPRSPGGLSTVAGQLRARHFFGRPGVD